ncbi:branched-chain amino acid ABC transporter ATP-binding protein/permease [Rhodopila sp.]|uniref:branched-chain amino acid ABC transporter ATP-binding protein/permease n=1 Tax=Rhodopila sp. TaxID=2480087 RepID=UPI002C759B3E|nr:branched-chain amino acid ABC transporter ATP-binding protein/permease [Rhodopila sp.]HVZ06423.1 branched-chain amino acid ABC transporter ATP-binding protein/permease [Rhodopila sp.]
MTPLRHPILLILLVFIALSALWTMIGAPITLITQIAIYMLYGAGVCMLVSYTGLVPFGASVFFGCASYAVAFFMLRGGSSEFAALAWCIVFSLILAAIIALIILRRRGLYFSLLTLAFSQIAFEISYKWTSVTGGENGLQGVARPIFASDWSFHIFTVVTVTIGMWLLWRIAHSPFGRSLQALRDNEQRAQSLGYSTFGLKFVSFVLMGGFIGYAGGLLSFMLKGAYADNLSWQHAGDSLLMAVLGGVHHFLGPLWGAIAFILLEDRLSAITESWWLIFAPIVILFALASPEGIQGLVFRLMGRSDWTLTRRGIPPRPGRIEPFYADHVKMDPETPILAVEHLSKRFGSLVTANDIGLQVYPYRLHSFIGPNGAGKTTFFNMLTGILKPNAGRIRFDGNDITALPVHKRIRLGLARSFQILSVFPNLTAFENVRIAVQAQEARRWGLWRDAYSYEDLNARTWSLLAAVGLEDRAAESCANLSHGQRRLLEIAITLGTDAKLLLLDEPLAGLAEADREVVGALIRKLADTHAVLLIEHDIDRVLALSDRITVLHQGRLIADGKPHEVAANPDVVAAYLGTERILAPPPPSDMEQRQHAAGKPLLVLDRLRAGYAGSVVLEDLSLTVHEGEAVALLGRNGVGKTTTLRAITGTVRSTGGAVTFDGAPITNARSYEINRRGVSLVPEGRRLFPNLTVLDNLKLATRPGGASLEEVFTLFPKLRILQRSKAESLSGGERQMLAIARALVVPAKLILLDEPFEGLAPTIVKEVMDALAQLRGRVAMVIVEHHAETVLPLVDRAYVLVNGRVAFEGTARALEQDEALQTRLLGVVHAEAA